MPQSPPSLTPRLLKIADITPECNCFADIGTDHAYLPVYLTLTDKCKKAIASDIGEGPLKRADNTIRHYSVGDTVSTRLGAGLDTLDIDEADVVSIAGMGGLIIAKILEDGISKLGSIKKIIIQPMSSIPDLREFLWKNGWNIEDEYISIEDEKIYTIMTVTAPDGNQKYIPDDLDIFIGKRLIETQPDGFCEYLESQIKKFENIVDGLKNSDSEEASIKAARYKKLLIKTKELINIESQGGKKCIE